MFGTGEVWGIAFGGSDLRAVKMARSGDQVSVLEAEVIPYAPAGAGEEGDREMQVRQALQALVAKYKIRREMVAIAVPGNAVFSKFITLPPVEKKRVPEIVKYESRQQIPFPIDEVVWDYQLVKTDLIPGEEIEVALFAIRREIIQGHLANCLAAGLSPRLVQAAPLAFCNYLQFDQPSDEPVAILDVERESTELLIIDGERTWPRSLGVGSHDLTVALQQKFQITLEKAEELKVQAVKSKQADRLFGVMKPVLQNLVGQVQRTLGFYKSQHPEVRFSKVLLVGEFFDLPGIEGFFKESLRYEFARLGAPRKVVPDEGLAASEFKDQAPALGVAFGLGLQALGLGGIRTNLVPPENVQRLKQSAKRPWVAAAVVLAGVAAGFHAAKASKDREALDGALQKAQQEIDADRKLIEDKSKAMKASHEPEEQLKQITGLLKDRETGLGPEVFPDILQKVTEAIPQSPENIWMDSLRVEPIRIGDIPFLKRMSSKDAWPAWSKDREQKQALWVSFYGRKVASGKQADDFEYVNQNFAAKLQEMKVKGPGPNAKDVKFCDKYDADWIPESKLESDSGVAGTAPTEYYVFRLDCVVNPLYYETLEALATATSSAPVK